MAVPKSIYLLFMGLSVWITPVLSINYGPPPLIAFTRRLPLSPAEPEIFLKNVTVQESSPLRPAGRFTGRPYVFFQPLTFYDKVPAKKQEVAITSKLPSTEEVGPRILNRPQVYPEFEVAKVPYRIVEEVPVAENVYTSEEDTLDPKRPVILPQHRLPPQKNNVIYQYKTVPPQKHNEEKIEFIPEAHAEKRAEFLTPKTFLSKFPRQEEAVIETVVSSKPLSPSISLYTRGAVPKHRPLPLQAYNKATIAVTPPPLVIPEKVQYQQLECVCVQFYLCKNGVINSGGRLQDIPKRPKRSFNYFTVANKTGYFHPGPSKIVNAHATRRSGNVCGPDKVCCQVFFEDNVDEKFHDNHYPVATPSPEPAYPFPPRFPARQQPEPPVCGVQRVNGVQGRLRQLRYTADVSEFGEYPWQVAILKKVQGDKNLYLCGGVLISQQWVATVAHCLTKDKASPILIRLGEWDVNRKDEIYPFIEKNITTIVIHPKFDPESLENDVALLRMVDPVDTKIPHVTPACLPYPGQIFQEQKCWVSGWGKDFFGPQGEYQNVLKEVDVPVISPALCNAELRSTKLGPNFKLHPGFLCAGGEAGKDACTGDGGSPLVCKSQDSWFVVGLVSWGIGCGQPGVPGVYLNVLYYIDWIKSIILR